MPSKTALLSDIHGNSPALKAVLENIKQEQCDVVFMLGDLINGVDPHGCVDLLRTWSEQNKVQLACIKGNAEAYLLTSQRSTLPRQEEGWNWDMMQLTQWWQDHLSASDIEWISSFPDTLRWRNAFLVHDSPMDRLAVELQSDPEILPHQREWFFHGKGLLPDVGEHVWQQVSDFMEQYGFLQLFCGHTHIPFQKTIRQKVICNLGSVGMPLDGDYRGSWVRVEDDAISIRRVDYDVSLIHTLIDNCPDYYDFQTPGFCTAYKKSIATGKHWREYFS